ncbi:ApaG protein [Bathymodiolus heckerae thiotrophic gill symbiont]|uniref:Co2+/Mg2+ efflux protein ApaG n=1 Tax=Bathymodiolus heckerae thiotrophic gill symbiont TaxID=1052212 RepID=UPI0010B1AAF1|nr:Co2+/Mg2+ efflux protein ApaG [Bathymodiolus heckerae thiotrophic gill symbiont]CAC9454217.1 ApaG protein [uncultured Gammaproteobacteria bacterium]SMN13087.1 ApaG protein [Bathymodiolus heckerae thiotrophic gill symbiont]
MKNNIKITVKAAPLAQQTIPFKSQYAFSYTITISNQGEVGAQLLSRHWIIQDETGYIEEVVGEGVIGIQPHLLPGEAFEYTSGSVIKTPTGTMKGEYGMVSDTGERFNAEILEFVLSEPYTLQ